ncbi:BQ5605_C010g05885 [Microbotryum silenes-dioicae]|uniref:Dolichol-phosphate mannosyltransferase subunit 1 n=1 Tax=Microbotryum silenes-dioicae TaxID=796604 RepID=A0A2X0NST5_9BASI|nr:BQ5605_C010g05885 [Microbotryum silenes-dioicae]
MMRLRLRFGRRSVHVALPLFAVVLIWSYWTLAPSSSRLYDPRTSAIHKPLPQPLGGPITSSIIVPAYKERANLRPLTERIFQAVRDKASVELVIVDDNSGDGTETEIADLRNEGYNVELLVRTGEKGLSSAVLRGFEIARGSSLIVMDADLQHPPETIQPLLDSLSDETPIALATRYGKGVSMSKGWPLYRRVISWGARTLARPLTSASDPMTGFFAIRRDHFLKSRPINSSGFKIALELMLKTPPSRIAESPYSFGLRQTGTSKLSSKVMVRYVGQLLTLYAWKIGILFHVLVALGVGLGVLGLEKAVGIVRRRKGTGPMLVGHMSRERKPMFIPGGGGGGGGGGLRGNSRQLGSTRNLPPADRHGKRMM